MQNVRLYGNLAPLWIKVLPLSSVLKNKSSVCAMLESKEDSYLILTCLVSVLMWVLPWICTNKSRCGSSIRRLTHLPSAEDQREDSCLGNGDFHWKPDWLSCIWCRFSVGYERDEAGLSCKHKGKWKAKELLMRVPNLTLVGY